MSLPVDVEEEYLDDLIQLIPSDDITPEPEGFSYYQQKSYVPVSFFNNERNLRLLNNCRPLRIELVDCKKGNHVEDCDNGCTDDDEEESEVLSVEAKYILNKICSNRLTIKRKNNINRTKTEQNIKSVDFKKNRGLIGMKVSKTFEIIEIDSESDEWQISNEKQDNVSKPIEIHSAVGMEVVNDILNFSKDFTKLYNNDLKCYSNNNDEENTLVSVVNTDLTGDKQRATNELLKLSVISNIDDHKQIKLKTPDSIRNEEIIDDQISNCEKDVQANEIVENTQENEENYNDAISTILKGNLKQNMLRNKTVESTQQTNRDVVVENIREDKEKNKSDTVMGNGSASPVFPCTSQIKNKKLNKNRHDTSSLVINQPKDFNDNRFKPNRINSPKNNTQKFSEKLKDIKINLKEHIPGKETITTVISKSEFKPTKLLDCNSYIKTQQNDATLPSQSNKICELTTVNVDNRCFKTPPHRECLNTTAVFQSETSNKEKIIRIKFNENIYKDAIEKQKNDKDKICTKTQATANVVNMTSKLPSQPVGCANHSNRKKQPFLSVDTILDHNINVNDPNVGTNHVHVFQKIGSSILRPNPKHTSIMFEKRHQSFARNRIRPYTGSIPSVHNVVNELSEPKNIAKSNDSSKYVGFAKINPDQPMQNKISDPEINFSPHVTDITNAPNPTAYFDHQNDMSAIRETMNTGSSVLNCFTQNPVAYENGKKILLQNSSEQNISKSSQSSLSTHQKQNCSASSFGPQPRQYVRSLLRNDGKQVLSVRNYPYNINNRNPVPMAPYPVYTNNYNSYWPYLYARFPPPPPPPPPPSPPPPPRPPPPPLTIANSSNPKFLHSPGIVDTPENIIKQVNIMAGPTNEKFQYNTNNRHNPHIIDININNVCPPKNSPTVVSSKSEMFEELEKEMMNIHNEDLECFLNKELRDCRTTSHNNSIMRLDPRTKSCSNVANNMWPLTKKSDRWIENEAFGEQFTKSLKRPSDIIISKDNVKQKKNVISKSGINSTPVKETKKSSLGYYSPPILPLPSYQKTLKILTRASNDAQKCLAKSFKQKSLDAHYTKNTNTEDIIKKISLDEYKNREDKKRTCERKKRKCESNIESKSVKKYESKNSDQDQGYDSDSTMIL